MLLHVYHSVNDRRVKTKLFSLIYHALIKGTMSLILVIFLKVLVCIES